MFVIKYRVRLGLNKSGGIVAMAAVPAYAPVWTPDPSMDVVFDLEELKKQSESAWLLILEVGFIQPSDNEFVVPHSPFQQMRLSNRDGRGWARRDPNLTVLCGSLVAARNLKKGEELICPEDFDQSLNWKRLLSRNGYTRANNVNPARPTLAGFLRYVRRQQRGVR